MDIINQDKNDRQRNNSLNENNVVMNLEEIDMEVPWNSINEEESVGSKGAKQKADITCTNMLEDLKDKVEAMKRKTHQCP